MQATRSTDTAANTADATDSLSHSSADANALATPRTAALDDAPSVPTMYWGVASGSSIKALRIASQGATVEDHGWTVDGSKSPMPGYAEISYTTANRDQIFPGPEWFVDCGGYSELVDDGEYSFDTEEYVAWLAEQADRGVDIGYYALRDWPVTKELLRENGRSERTHQRWTVRDHVKTLELADEYGLHEKGCKPMAVIQGQDTAGYLFHLNHLREQGLLTDHVCIGSLKKLSPTEVENVATAVRDALPSKHTMHGLGLTQRHLEYPAIRDAFDTIDTQSWNKARNRISDEFAAVQDTWIGYLRGYEQYVETLASQNAGEQQGTGTQLFDFGSDGRDAATGHYDAPMSECVCGTLLDPNAIRDLYDNTVTTENTEPLDAIDLGGCRHCRRRILNIRMQVMSGEGRYAPENG